MVLVLAIVGTLVAAALLTAGLTVAVWYQRDRPGARPFAVLMAATTWWVIGYGVRLFQDTLAAQLFWQDVTWFGIAVVPIAWIAFVLEYTGYGELLTVRTVAVIGAFPLATVGLVWFYPGVMRTGARLVEYGPVTTYTASHGLAYYLFLGFSYAAALWGAVWLLAFVRRSRPVYRWQGIAISAMALSPLLLNLLQRVVRRPWPELDLTPFSLVVTGIVGVFAITRFDSFDAVPVADRIANEVVVDAIDDAVLVVDEDGTIIDTNASARRRFEAGLEGDRVDTVLPTTPAEWDPDDGYQSIHALSIGDDERYVDVSARPIRTYHGRLTGWVVTCHDVTERRRRRRRLDALNRILRQTLQEESIYGDAVTGTGGEDEEPGQLSDRAIDALEAGEVAEEFDDPSDSVDVVPVVQREADVAGAQHPDVSFDVEAPLEDWAYCDGVFEPTIRALLRTAANRADGSDPRVGVTVQVDAAETVTVEVSIPGPRFDDRERELLSGDRVDPDDEDDLPLWLVGWGIERLDGVFSSRREDGRTVVTLEVPRAGDGSEWRATSGRSIADE